MKIYVASSWRNRHQPGVVAALREHDHEVYDFRNPSPGDSGFAWAQVDPEWQDWSLADFVAALRSGRAQEGFGHDRGALEWCECCVLVLPAGASAHLEAGWCSGRDKLVLVYAPELREPELMYKLFDSAHPAIVATIAELLATLSRLAPHDGTRLR